MPHVSTSGHTTRAWPHHLHASPGRPPTSRRHQRAASAKVLRSSCSSASRSGSSSSGLQRTMHNTSPATVAATLVCARSSPAQPGRVQGTGRLVATPHSFTRCVPPDKCPPAAAQRSTARTAALKHPSAEVPTTAVRSDPRMHVASHTAGQTFQAWRPGCRGSLACECITDGGRRKPAAASLMASACRLLHATAAGNCYWPTAMSIEI